MQNVSVNRSSNVLASAVQWKGATETFEGTRRLVSPDLRSVYAHARFDANYNFARMAKPTIFPLFPREVQTSALDAMELFKSASLEFHGYWTNPTSDKDHMTYEFVYTFKPTQYIRGDDIIEFDILTTWFAQDDIHLKQKTVDITFPGLPKRLDVDAILDIISVPKSSMTTSRVYGSFEMPHSIVPFSIEVSLKLLYEQVQNIWYANDFWLNFAGAYSFSKLTTVVSFNPIYNKQYGDPGFHEEPEDLSWIRDAFALLYYIPQPRRDSEWEFV